MFGMDSVKLILIGAAALCVLGVGFYFWQTWDLEEVRQDVNYCFHRVLPEVGRLSADVYVKQEEIRKDLRRGVRLNEYVETQSHRAGISYDNLELERPREKKNTREGYIDETTEINTSGKRGRVRFSRRSIASFIFLLENKTNGLKVTSLTLDRPDEDREQWSLNLEVTERKPLRE